MSDSASVHGDTVIGGGAGKGQRKAKRIEVQNPRSARVLNGREGL
jgi:hypothetical protein